jgi:hypothetical protein
MLDAKRCPEAVLAQQPAASPAAQEHSSTLRHMRQRGSTSGHLQTVDVCTQACLLIVATAQAIRCLPSRRALAAPHVSVHAPRQRSRARGGHEGGLAKAHPVGTRPHSGYREGGLGGCCHRSMSSDPEAERGADGAGLSVAVTRLSRRLTCTQPGGGLFTPEGSRFDDAKVLTTTPQVPWCALRARRETARRYTYPTTPPCLATHDIAPAAGAKELCNARGR